MAKKKTAQPAFVPFEETNPIKKIKLLVTIVNRDQGEFFLSLLKKHEVGVQMKMLGHGTASSSIKEMLSIGETDKDIVVSVVREEKVAEVMAAIEQRFSVSHKAKGVAFTIPVNSVVGVSIYKFLTNTTTIPGGK